ncbi:MAG: DNA polymerase [Akkermansia sp.]
MKTYAIDFECYYDKEVSITTQGYHHYLRDPKCDIYMVAIYSREAGFSFVGSPSDLDWEQFSKAHFVAHNASFDKACFERLKELDIVPKSVNPAWDCTADLAAFLSSGRSLGAASAELLNVTLPKTTRDKMKGKTWLDALNNRMGEELSRYCLNDAKTSYYLWCSYSTEWTDTEIALSRHTRSMCDRGVFIDRTKLQEGLEQLGNTLVDAQLEIPWAGESPPLSPKALREACAEAGIPAPKSLAADSQECAAWEERYGEAYPWVDAMRRYRRSNTLLKKLQTLESRIRPDGTFGYGLKYFGAHTGRWSGDAGYNVQNLPRTAQFGVDLRSMIIPREGKVFIISDLGQIEQRVLSWLAGDNAMMEQLATGISVYEAHARATMGWDKPDELKHANPDLYRLAKARVLGLGYGAGATVFVQIAKTMAGLDITPNDANRIVSDFRKSNPLITALWSQLERAFKANAGHDFTLPLPSGRAVRYRKVLSSPKGFGASVQGRRVPFFGGKLAENLTSATARDVLGEAILRIENAGYPVVMHVHDEVIVEVDADQAETALAEIDKLMTTPPAWLEGLPLTAESFISTHYTK